MATIKKISKQKLNTVIKGLPVPVQKHCKRTKMLAAYIVEQIKTEEWFLDTEAVRVKVYKNSIPTTYAKLAADGTPEPGTTPFEGGKKVLSELSEDLAPGEITKYTIVIWLEGNDPECLDNIKGGSVKMSLMFSVVEDTETQSEA